MEGLVGLGGHRSGIRTPDPTLYNATYHQNHLKQTVGIRGTKARYASKQLRRSCCALLHCPYLSSSKPKPCNDRRYI
nr:unnamed protein product [Haemonchus contortus]